MPRNKIHFNINNRSACGRGTWLSQPDLVSMVDCLACMKQPEYIKAKEAHDAARKAAFDAQEPRTVIEPWKRSEVMSCKSCGGDKFRQGDRTCYGHYDNWVCANCGNTESRLTETGMSS